jgi:hypothetical protein
MPEFHSPNSQSHSNVPTGTRRLDNQILRHCSAGPWQHGLHVLPFSADSQTCVFGNERELPIACLDSEDEESAANVLLMAAGWELCRQLGLLLDATTQTIAVPGNNPTKLHSQCQNAADLLHRIHRDIHQSTAERYGKECEDDD